MFPKALRDRFYSEDLACETVVFDSVTRQTRSLNATAAFVWRHSDGGTSLEELGRLVSRAFDTDEGLEIAKMAVTELNSAGMLELGAGASQFGSSLNRRQLLAKAAAVSLLIPMVSVAQQTKPPKKHTSFVPKTAKQGGSDF